MSAYAVALNLASKVEVVNASLYTVLLPDAAGLAGDQAIASYVRQSLKRSAIVGLGLSPIFVLAHPILTLLYGGQFAAAAPILQSLAAVVILDLFLTPLLLLAYPASKPQLLAGAEALRVGTLVVVASLLIPNYGPLGAVTAKFVAKVVGATFALGALWRSRQLPGQRVSRSST